jgi:hypothetical protein
MLLIYIAIAVLFVAAVAKFVVGSAQRDRQQKAQLRHADQHTRKTRKAKRNDSRRARARSKGHH